MNVRYIFLILTFLLFRDVIADLILPGAFLYGSESNYFIWSWTEPNAEGYGAAIGVNADPDSYLMTINQDWGGTAGIGHVWYSVSEGVVIDTAFATNTTPFYSSYDIYNFSQSIEMWPQPFMLAFWLDATGSDIPDLGDTFGWAEFTYDGTTLSLVDSAAENDGVGIIAGKYEQVPEPATILLFGIGGVGVWLLRRNRKQ